MTERSQQFGNYLLKHLDEKLDALCHPVADIIYPNQDDGAQHVREGLRSIILTIATAIADDDAAMVNSFASKLGETRASERSSFRQMLMVYVQIHKHIWDQLEQFTLEHSDWKSSDFRAVDALLQSYHTAYFGSFRNFYEQIQDELFQQREAMEQQRRLIREIGTPIVPLYAGIVLVPLVGTIDESRASMLLEHVLEAISQQQAQTVLLDITGVPVVDTSIANNIIMLARAAKLLGAQVIMAGIGPDIAQTIVHLGIGMEGIATHANLQSAIVSALSLQGLGIRPK